MDGSTPHFRSNNFSQVRINIGNRRKKPGPNILFDQHVMQNHDIDARGQEAYTASLGVSTMGSPFTLKEVLTNTGTPVIASNSFNNLYKTSFVSCRTVLHPCRAVHVNNGRNFLPPFRPHPLGNQRKGSPPRPQKSPWPSQQEQWGRKDGKSCRRPTADASCT